MFSFNKVVPAVATVVSVVFALATMPCAAWQDAGHARVPTPEDAREAEARGDVAGAVRTWTRCGADRYYAGQLSSAELCFENVLRLEPLAGSAFTTQAHAFLGAIDRRFRRFEAALVHLERALEGLAGLDLPGLECFALHHMGDLCLETAELDRALDAFRRFEALATRASNPSWSAQAWSGLARTLAVMGDREDAERYHLDAVAVAVKLQESDPYTATQVHIQAGLFYQAGGSFLEAEEQFSRARTIAPEWASDLRMTIQGQLGGIYASLGRYELALACSEWRIEEVRAGRAEADEAEMILGAAGLSLFFGDFATARRTLEDFLDQCTDDPRMRIAALIDLGLAEMEEGELDAAHEHLEQAAIVCRELGDAREWRARVYLGTLARRRERYDRALEQLQLALEAARELGNPSAEAHVLAGQAYTHLCAGDARRAMALARDSAERLEQLGQTGAALAPLHTLAAAALLEGELELARELAETATSSLAAVSTLEPRRAAGVRSRFALWGEVSQDLAFLDLERAGPEEGARERIVAEGLHQAGLWKGRALLEGIPQGVAELPSAPSELVASLNRLASERRVVVEYAEGAGHLYAYVVDGERVEPVDLGEAAGIRDELEVYLGGISDPNCLGDAEFVAEHGNALYRALMLPLLEGREDVEELVIVPAPSMARLPLEALVADVERRAGEELTFADLRFVGDRRRIAYCPSSQVLTRLTEAELREGGKLLILADPVFYSETPDRDRSSSGANTEAGAGVVLPFDFQRLPATRSEAISIARTFLHVNENENLGVRLQLDELDDRDASIESPTLELRLGRGAAVQRLRGDLKPFRIIHLAAHGQVDLSDPLRTRLLLSYDSETHGVFGLADVVDLELDADLVVLSACETAHGRALRGEGVLSMAQAFLQAGARSVIASLWNVGDRETAATMRSFYDRHLREGRSAAAALAEAKSELRHARETRGLARGDPVSVESTRDSSGNPYYWAPFIYVGRAP